MPIAWPAGLARGARRIHRVGIFPALAFVFPSDCFACRRPLGPTQHLGACTACWSALRVLRPPLCRACGLPRPEDTDLLGPARGRCAACILAPSGLDGVRAVVEYDDVARAFLLRAKLGGRPELLEPLGRQLARAVAVLGWAEGCTAVVPVPSHPWVSLCRGFAPGAVLARHVAGTLGLPLRKRTLVRNLTAGRSVKRLGAPARRLRAAGAHRVRGTVEGERLLLVDDVMTTGATAQSCAASLKRAGAQQVRAAVWARTPRRT